MGLSPFRHWLENSSCCPPESSPESAEPKTKELTVNSFDELKAALARYNITLVSKSKGPVNPDPGNFKILRSVKRHRCVVAEIEYTGCTNFEGKKILVYLDTYGELFEDLPEAKRLDPHFSRDTWLSPIARFEPTKRGWNWALLFADSV